MLLNPWSGLGHSTYLRRHSQASRVSREVKALEVPMRYDKHAIFRNIEDFLSNKVMFLRLDVLSYRHIFFLCVTGTVSAAAS